MLIATEVSIPAMQMLSSRETAHVQDSISIVRRGFRRKVGPARAGA